MQHAAEYWRDHLLKIGATKAEVMPTIGNPVVYAERIIDPNAKNGAGLWTLRRDAGDPEPLELWKSDPFAPEIRTTYLGTRCER